MTARKRPPAQAKTAAVAAAVPVTAPVSASAPDEQTLYTELHALIERSRQRLAGAVNAELTQLYWAIGARLHHDVLGGERARYGDQLVARLGTQLANAFGRGFETKNLRRMVQFAQAFPDTAIVATLSRQLSWSHVVSLLPLKSSEAQQFYAHRSAEERWSVRELRQQIERKAYERTALTERLPMLRKKGALPSADQIHIARRIRPRIDRTTVKIQGRHHQDKRFSQKTQDKSGELFTFSFRRDCGVHRINETIRFICVFMRSLPRTTLVHASYPKK